MWLYQGASRRRLRLRSAEAFAQNDCKMIADGRRLNRRKFEKRATTPYARNEEKEKR
jgi:hypothetical protein